MIARCPNTGARAPGLRATGHPPDAISPGPINTLQRSSVGRYPEKKVVFCCFVRSYSCFSFLLLVLVLAFRVKERVCTSCI